MERDLISKLKAEVATWREKANAASSGSIVSDRHTPIKPSIDRDALDPALAAFLRKVPRCPSTSLDLHWLNEYSTTPLFIACLRGLIANYKVSCLVVVEVKSVLSMELRVNYSLRFASQFVGPCFRSDANCG